MRYCANTLQELHINHSVNITTNTTKTLIDPAGVSALYNRCVHFKRFVWMVWLDDNSAVLSSCNAATVIRLCEPARDSVLVRIAQHCKEMQHLDLVWDSYYSTKPAYTSNGLRAVIQSCLKLQAVWVGTKTDLTDVSDIVHEHPALITKGTTQARDNCYDVLNMPI